MTRQAVLAVLAALLALPVGLAVFAGCARCTDDNMTPLNPECWHAVNVPGASPEAAGGVDAGTVIEDDDAGAVIDEDDAGDDAGDGGAP